MKLQKLLSDPKIVTIALLVTVIVLCYMILRKKEEFQYGRDLTYIPPQKAYSLPTVKLYSDEQLSSVAKKYAPMCMLHPDEQYFPVNVKWWFDKTKPVNFIENGETKVWLDLVQRRDQLIADPESIVPEFKGSGIPVPSSHPSGKEIREESYCHVLVMPDGAVVLVYFFIFAYNYGKSVCVGVNVEEEFRHFRHGIFDDIARGFKKAGTAIYDKVLKPAGTGIADVGKQTYSKVIKPTFDFTKKGLRFLTGSDCLGTRYRFGNHIGDIEGCAVYLDKNLNPYKLYFGAHDFNFLEDWNSPKIVKVNNEGVVDDLNPSNNTHPLILMALGSHGTWLSQGANDYTPGILKTLDKVSIAGKLTDVTPTLTVPTSSNIQQLKLASKTVPLVNGIPWMTWKSLQVVYPREWSGEDAIQSDLSSKGITNYITQVARFGGLPVNPDTNEKVIGQKRLENGPPGMSGKYGDYVPWGKSVLNEVPVDCKVDVRVQECKDVSPDSSGKFTYATQYTVAQQPKYGGKTCLQAVKEAVGNPNIVTVSNNLGANFAYDPNNMVPNCGEIEAAKVQASWERQQADWYGGGGW